MKGVEAMLKLLKKLNAKDWILACIAFVFIIAQVWLSLTMPDYMSEITKLVQTQGNEMKDVLIAGGKMLLCALGSLLSAVCTAICAARISANFRIRCANRYFIRYSHFQWRRSESFQRRV